MIKKNMESAVKTDENNVHTEKQAFTKWCPHARLHGGNNRYVDEPWPKCIGSECMMWLWVAEECKEGYVKAPKDVALGYCGLNKSDTNWGLYDATDAKLEEVTKIIFAQLERKGLLDNPSTHS